MTILELGMDELRHGVLAAGFAAGSVAAVIRSDGMVRRLWDRLVDDRREQLPWEAPLLDIARNHHGTDDITVSLGDLFYFQPGQHGYIARKIEIERGEDGAACRSRPAAFVQGETSHAPDAEALTECLEFADRLMLALTPEGTAPPPARIAVQRLKYQPRAADFESLAELTAHSLGRWGRLGAAIDRQRQRAAGPFAGKGVSDAMAILLLIPGAARPIARLLAWAARRDPRAGIAEGDVVVERAHFDTRQFTALAGRRSNVRTEIFAQGQWRELPIGLDSIAVFPGSLARRSLGLEPTLHRVLYAGNAAAEPIDRRTGNVTLLIGAV
ncbi:MAG TPA: hypothetical protein VFT56_09475 [Sphingomonas sp.]|nr:hypothetical protein [Sphingomonas sp.]